MADKYSTIQQHQPLRVPDMFDRQGRALIVQLDEIFDDIYRRFGRLRVEDLGDKLKDLCLLKDEDGNYVAIHTEIGSIQLEVGDIDGVMSSLGITSAGIDMQGNKYIKLKSGGTFRVESDGIFEVDTANLFVDATTFYVKEGILKGDHYDTEGNPLMRRDALVVSTEEPANPYDGMVWVKPLGSSATVNYTLPVASATAVNGFTGTLTTPTGVNDPSASGYKYRLKFPIHTYTSSGTENLSVTATVGGLSFSQTIPKGDYATGFDRVFDQTVTSNTWLGTNTTLSITVTASGQMVDYYKINAGTIEFTASYSGTDGTGWKTCEVKVYKE